MLISICFASILHKYMLYVYQFCLLQTQQPQKQTGFLVKLTIRNFNRIVTNDPHILIIVKNILWKKIVEFFSIQIASATRWKTKTIINNGKIHDDAPNETTTPRNISSIIWTRNVLNVSLLIFVWIVIRFYQKNGLGQCK